MKQKIQILPSGIALIDRAWGGLYRAGSYLLVGSHKSGRTTLALEYAKECLEQGEVCVYFTTRRPKDLIIHAVSINIDLQNDISQNKIIVIRVDSAIDLGETREDDSVLTDYIEDIKGMVEKYQPAKIIFDELTPFLGFKNLKLLESAFAKTIEAIEESGVTSLFVVGDPITPTAKKVVDILAVHSTGIIYLQKADNSENELTSGIIAITPNVGHSEGKFKSSYRIIPGNGFIYESQNLLSSRYYTNGKSVLPDSKYTSLSDVNLPKEEYLVSNLYSYEDFNLIINNQIAFYKSTGQIFTLVAFKVDEIAEKEGVLTMNQLRNAIRLSIEKKDKMCAVSNKIIVLLTKEDQKDITGLISRVRSNLSANDNYLFMKILSSISVYALRVDESVNKSDDLLKELRSDELKAKNVVGSIDSKRKNDLTAKNNI